jgi:sulfonate transport system ATP-binding protein
VSENIIKIRDLSIKFSIENGELDVLQNINLDVKKGEFVCVVGASGCGKSTLLRIIAGLEKDYGGLLEVSGKSVEGPGTDRGVVFQESRLFPWLTTAKNIAFGLPKGTPKDVVRHEVAKHFSLVGLNGFEKAYPGQLSGGMQQRASIARALINNPAVLLLDEPLGALDAFTRMNMQQEILKIWNYEKTTMILVTHDIDEAVFLADTVVLMSKRPGTIKKIIENPISRPRRRSSKEYMDIRNIIYQEFFAEFEGADPEYYI